MKKVTLFILFLFSFQLQAAACKCSCDPTDMRICASSYDLDHPCGNICPFESAQSAASCGAGEAGESTAAVVVAPMLTACPFAEVINPVTGRKMQIEVCPDN